MRHIIELKDGWQFTNLDGQTSEVSIPHTWNAIDGQDGGDDYKRGTCTYTLALQKPAFDPDTQEVWIEFDGVNASAQVSLNGQDVCSHDGGYSTFRANLTGLLADENELVVKADNSKNDRVYPQMADFTFYGGIYRMVRLLVVNKAHFALDYLGSSGIRVTATPEGAGAKVRVQSRVTTGDVTVTLIDRKGRVVGTGAGLDTTIEMAKARRWHGVEDPYLYTARCEVTVDGSVTDRLEIPFGVRSFRVDEKHGFILNDEPYDLHGVSRHQDRKGIGNAITREMHDEDMALIREIGATTLRLAHYQHDQYFYDLCDRNGLIVWAEIPYISKHMPNGRTNTISQMEELIEQNYNHASIVCWGVSNEITIATKDKQDMLDNHRLLNDMIHQTDPTRFTTLACYAMCGPFNKVAHITDVVSWNLYLGWYVDWLLAPVLPQAPAGVQRVRRRGDAEPAFRSSAPQRPHRGVSGGVPRVHAAVLPAASVDVGEPRLEHVRLRGGRARSGRRTRHEPQGACHLRPQDKEGQLLPLQSMVEQRPLCAHLLQALCRPLR